MPWVELLRCCRRGRRQWRCPGRHAHGHTLGEPQVDPDGMRAGAHRENPLTAAAAAIFNYDCIAAATCDGGRGGDLWHDCVFLKEHQIISSSKKLSRQAARVVVALGACSRRRSPS